MSDGDKELNIKITSQAQLDAADAAAARVEKVADAVAAQTKATERATETQKENARATSEQADTLSELGRRGNGARDVFEGLTAAGKSEEGMLFNLTKAWRGLSESMRVNPFLGVVGLVAGAIGLFAQLAARMAETGAQYLGIGKRSQELEKDLEELQKTSEEMTKALVQQATEAKNAWDGLVSAMDRAKQRADQMANAQQAAQLAEIDAQEAAALARAPESQRDAIKEGFNRRRGDTRARFEQGRLTGEATQAGVERNNAEEAIASAGKRLFAVEVAANAAAKALENIESVGRDAAKSGASPGRIADISKEIAAARRTSEAANKQLEEARAREQPLIDSANQRRNDAQDRLELNTVERRTFRAQQTTRQLTEQAQTRGRQTRDREQISGLEDRARAAAASGNSTEQDRLVRQIRETRGPTPEMAAAAAASSQSTQRAAEVIIKAVTDQGSYMSMHAVQASAAIKEQKRKFDLAAKQLKNSR